MGKNIRARVAREAAVLLYRGVAQEYKQAKEKAAETLGVRVLPSNLEVAIELDKVADEIEGSARKDLIVGLRKLALHIMMSLRDFNPKLIGSVWRGTSYRGSDIDILVFSSDAGVIVEKLREARFNVTKTEWHTKVEEGEVKNYFHIHLSFPMGDEAEVIVRSPEDLFKQEKCDIHGDIITGLTINQLKEVLERDPLQKFMPKGK